MDNPNWADIDAIRAEWPAAALDPAADTQGYRRALVLFERDDYPAMMECATLFATALAHSLYGPGLFQGAQLADLVHKTLYCALSAPPDRRTFADSAQRAARLGLTIMRENGWQPAPLGGARPVSEAMIMHGGNYQLLSVAIAPPSQLMGDLRTFFAVPPRPVAAPNPDSDFERGRGIVDRLHETIQRSQAGDPASILFVDGAALEAQGRPDEALAKYAEAARLGSVDAMASAGDVCSQLGRRDEAVRWYAGAAQGGHPTGMFNTAIAAVEGGDRRTAAQWFQRAAEAGNAEGYAALTQLADDAGDAAGEAHWARLGAEAGQLFCMGRHGLLLARDANGDAATLYRARDVLEPAAERGHVASAALAVSVNHQLGDQARLRHFVDLVVRSGDAEQIDRLRRYGYLG